MRTSNTIFINGNPARIYELAANIQDWPRLLPHYRYVRVEEESVAYRIPWMGAGTTIGSGVDGLWDGILRERSAVRRITRFDPSPFPAQIAAEVPDFDPSAWIDPRGLRRMDRCSQFALVSARMAVADAGIDLE